MNNKVLLEDAQLNLVASGEGKLLLRSVLEKEEEKLDTLQKIALHQWLQNHGVLVVESESFLKQALYYFEKGRRYRPSKQELSNGKFLCPKCKVLLRKTIYKLRTPLFGCPECGWSIRRDDIWDPEPKEEPITREPGDVTKKWLDL